MKVALLLFTAILTCSASFANPITVPLGTDGLLVSTGTPEFPVISIDLKSTQWFATQFTLQYETAITDPLLWAQVDTPGVLLTAIYANVNGKPDQADGPIFATDTSWVQSGRYKDPQDNTNEPMWIGPRGLDNWLLSAGTYWIAFEIPPDFGLSGDVPCCFSNPLSAYLSTTADSDFQFTNVLSADSHSDFGVEIFGIPGVPEPSSWLLLVSGLALLPICKKFLQA